MKQSQSRFSILLALIILSTSVFSCILFTTEKKTNLFYHFYSIEPESMLTTLEAGDTNVFVPIQEQPPYIPYDQQTTVTWTQDDYLRIANALFKFIWNDNLNGWQLNSMDFTLDCTKYDVGFQDGNFRFYKNIEMNGRESRTERIINIDPRNKFLFITENEYYPRLFNWSSIELGQTQLSARDILQIAEKAGGQERRLSIENTCDISMLLYPDYASYNGWKVDYTRNDGTSLNIQIDPVTGEIRSP